MIKISRKLKHLLIFALWAVFFIFIGAVTVQAATYYVTTTGKDSNPGTQGFPWANPQKCTASPIQAGDTCLVGDGIYTDPNLGDTTYNVIQINSASPWNSVAGTALAPITIKSLNPYGAKLVVPAHFSNSAGDGSNEGVKVSVSYYIIDGFEIYQTSGAANGTGNTNKGISIVGNSTGTVIQNNKIHNIARLVCSTSVYGNAGIFIGTGRPTSTTIQNNLFYSIGRLRVGESGCGNSVNLDQNDHGMYIHDADTVAIIGNTIYDTNRGWPIHFNAPSAQGSTVSNVTIYNNTLTDKSPTNQPQGGQIELYGTLTNFTIKNNIFNDSSNWAIDIGQQTNFTNIAIDHNLTNIAKVTPGATASITTTNNLTNTSPGFVNAAGHNYRLSAGSAAINAGTNVGIPVPDGAIDIGAYEFSTQGGDAQPPAPPVNLSVR